MPVCSPRPTPRPRLHEEAAWLHCPHLTLASRANARATGTALRGWHYTLHASTRAAPRAVFMVMAAAAAGLGVAWCRCCWRRRPSMPGGWCRRTAGCPGTQGYWFVPPAPARVGGIAGVQCLAGHPLAK